MIDVTVRKLKKDEVESALALVLRVFLRFEAPDCTDEGVEEFRKTLRDKSFHDALTVYGAFRESELAGVIATRGGGKHIALFFVDVNHQRRGVGRRLFEAVRTDNMTVNSSPYAIPVYQKFGFIPTAPEQTVNGLRFTPMALS